MPLYLAPYVGSGTELDQFRPSGADGQSGWSAIDLRPDPSRQDGGGLSAALLWLPVADNSPQLDLMALDKLDTIPANTRNRIANKLGVTITATRAADIVGELLIGPPANGWQRVRFNRIARLYEVFLNMERWWAMPSIAGGASTATDDFNRADTASDLGGNWTAYRNGMHITSNRARGNTAGGGNTMGWTADTFDNDQYSQVKLASWTGTGNGGAAARVSGSSGSENAYYGFYTLSGNKEIGKSVTGTYTALSSTAASPSVNDIVRVEVIGSSITMKNNGAVVLGPVTDTSVTVAGTAGMNQLFPSVGNEVELDDWEGGTITGWVTRATVLDNLEDYSVGLRG